MFYVFVCFGFAIILGNKDKNKDNDIDMEDEKKNENKDNKIEEKKDEKNEEKEDYISNNLVFNPNSARSNYGKLMDRILKFKQKKLSFVEYLIPFAEQALDTIKYFNNNNNNNKTLNVAVLGDASGSMDVAIESSSIISSLLSVALNADLKFFNSNIINVNNDLIPKTVLETIKIVENTIAQGGTNMACTINYYIINNIKIDLFILVSDENENEKYNNMWFDQIFYKYLNEINKKCKLFLVSFLNVGEIGIIYNKCKNRNDNIIKKYNKLINNKIKNEKNKLLNIKKIQFKKNENILKTKDLNNPNTMNLDAIMHQQTNEMNRSKNNNNNNNNNNNMSKSAKRRNRRKKHKQNKKNNNQNKNENKKNENNNNNNNNDNDIAMISGLDNNNISNIKDIKLNELEIKEIEKKILNETEPALLIDFIQFRLHPIHPDTSKFDALLGMVALLLNRMQMPFEKLSQVTLERFSKNKNYEDIFECNRIANDVSTVILQFLE